MKVVVKKIGDYHFWRVPILRGKKLLVVHFWWSQFLEGKKILNDVTNVGPCMDFKPL